MKKIMILLFSALCFTACNDKMEDINTNVVEQQQAQISLSIQDATTVNTYSTANDQECMIDTAWVFVFDGTTGTKKWVERIEGNRIVNNGQPAQLLPQLKQNPAIGDTVVVIANIPTAGIDTSSYITCANINQYIHASSSYYYTHPNLDPNSQHLLDFRSPRLPMYGEMIWNPMSGCTCEMIRAVAKIQVQLAPGYYDVTGNFNAETVNFGTTGHAYGYLRPTSLINGIAYPAGTLLIPGAYWSLLQREDPFKILPATMPISRFTALGYSSYILEYPSSTKDLYGNDIVDTKFDPKRPHIILAKASGVGVWTNYRLDFYDHSTGKFLDIKRNHHYLFTIHSVNSEGYNSTTVGGANHGGINQAGLDYYGSNLEYTIKITDGSRAVTSNGQYAIVTDKDTIKLPAGAVTVPAAAFFRYEDPEGFVDKVDTTTIWVTAPMNAITMENVSPSNSMTVTPFGVYMPVANISPDRPFNPNAPYFNTRERHITTTNKPLEVSVNPGFVSGTVLFRLGNIQHRIYVVRQ